MEDHNRDGSEQGRAIAIPQTEGGGGLMPETLDEKLLRIAAEEEAAEESRGDEDEGGEVYRTRQVTAESSQVYAVRIPVDRMERLRELAAKLGVSPSSLIRQWVLERLDVGGGGYGGDLKAHQVDVAVLKAFADNLHSIVGEGPQRVSAEREWVALRNALFDLERVQEGVHAARRHVAPWRPGNLSKIFSESPMRGDRERT